MDFLVWLIGFYVIWTLGMFAVGPLLIGLSNKSDYPQKYPVIAVHEALGRVNRDALVRNQQLIAVGFVPESAVFLQQFKGEGLCLFYRQTTGAAIARLTYFKILSMEKVNLYFEQIYASGRMLCVSDWDQPSIYRGLYDDQDEMFLPPGQKDPAVLFESFTRIRSQMKMGMPAIPLPGSLAQREENRSNHLMKVLIDKGCYHPLRNGRFRPSLRASYRMTWRMLPPLKNILLARERRRAKAILAAAS